MSDQSKAATTVQVPSSVAATYQTIEAKPKPKHKLRSISTNKQYNHNESPTKLERIDFKKREQSFVLDCYKFSKLEDIHYDPLLDNNLRLYFYNPRNRMNLLRNGLIKRDGSPVDQKMYRNYLNQTTIQHNNSIETFYEKEVVKKHKQRKLPPIIKIGENTAYKVSKQDESLHLQSSPQTKSRQNSTESNTNNQIFSNFLTPQTKVKGQRSSSNSSSSKLRIPFRSNKMTEKEKETKKEKIAFTYGYTLDGLNEKRTSPKEKKKVNLQQQQYKMENHTHKNEDDHNESKILKKEDFDDFMQTLRDKYTKMKIKV